MLLSISGYNVLRTIQLLLLPLLVILLKLPTQKKISWNFFYGCVWVISQEFGLNRIHSQLLNFSMHMLFSNDVMQYLSNSLYIFSSFWSQQISLDHILVLNVRWDVANSKYYNILQKYRVDLIFPEMSILIQKMDLFQVFFLDISELFAHLREYYYVGTFFLAHEWNTRNRTRKSISRPKYIYCIARLKRTNFWILIRDR